ncbi:hypothetical protein EFO53_05290 [Lacticaseibacillus rhamnosus]|uniref:hypothetical protein n=1 Tax=Lacticaseibacillus rhamnosus TaxID=47715 RepID=UPI000665AE0F|nr:hypothetical protein [Lacticaseibacillus rhamnosus]MCT3147351.1 hypothetical protein [Lacticaseibacillus rhamnosus]OFM72291.1 hypothetical protein HMPREF2667_06385 [Lactobacillus sp. HMSC064F12]OFO60894.1 hypothetical protein HMPREF3026_07700 [Lactobacillus sp. HMSC073D04]
MAYVDKDDYMQAMHVTDADVPKNFDQLADLASEYLDDQTRGFYQVNDLASDPWPLRASNFKRAVIRQIAYMIDSGITTTEQAISQPTSVSKTIGRTTVSKSWNNSRSSADGQQHSVISADALAALNGTGLLCRGVDYAR